MAARPGRTVASLPPPGDDELVRRCLGKDAEAFAELYRRHSGPVLAFLHGLHGGDEDAVKDALQETFVRFHGALEALEPGRPVRPWLYRIARNVTLDLWKRRGRRPEEAVEPEALAQAAVARSADPADQAARREEGALLRRAVLSLPAEERAVFLLRHDLGHGYEEIAQALACSVRTAKYRMKAALERLGREAERMGVVR